MSRYPGAAARVGIVVAAASLLAAACSSGSSTATSTSTTGTVHASVPAARPVAAGVTAALTATLASAPACDVVDPTSCLLPFPSNHFTVADPSTPTGVKVHLPTGQVSNIKGVTLDPTEWNRNDGFSPGTPMIVNLPHVDLTASKAATVGDLGTSVTAASHTVVLDMTTGKRLPHWAELDSAPGPDGTDLTLVHPAVSLPEGHRIAVAFVGMVDHAGTPLTPSPGFAVYRDNRTTTIGSLEADRPEMERMFAALGAAGVDRSSLTVAWDFTVASAQSLAGRMLTIRDDAFAKLGSAAPAFHVDQTVTDPAKLHPGIARLVRGTFDVPSYLTGDGGPGSRFNDGADGRPTASGATIHAAFSCQVPTVAVSGAGGSARPVVYGHGLLGSHDEVENTQVAKIASTNDMVYCATDWIGMSESDLGNALKILNDISEFPSLADRSQQGILDTLFLGRLMIRPDGLGHDPAFRTSAGASVIDGHSAYFDGNSQGSIMGGAATAVAQDWTHAVLGVPGMDYSILLSRSVDFSKYFKVLAGAYPDRVDQQIAYGLLQMLWDRAETDGYAQHLTDHPYAGTPRHTVELDVAFGDHQVAPVTAELEARTIGARIHQPALAAGRDPSTDPQWGIAKVASYPTGDSVIEYWDTGSLAPDPGNLTPENAVAWKQQCGSLSSDAVDHSVPCHDPHEDPRRQAGTIAQKNAFFEPDGKTIDPCDGKACVGVPAFQLDY